MNNTHAVILSSATNNAVVQMPGRKYPGVVIQGDTLMSIIHEIEKVRDTLLQGKSNEAISDIKYLLEDLTGRIDFYEKVLEENNIQIPYKRGRG